MTVADDVLEALRANADGMTDSQLAELLGKRHQHVNQVCRQLAVRGWITRDDQAGEIVNRATGESTAARTYVPQPRTETASERAWPWEGNVQGHLVAHLVANGWSIIRVADTALRERGTDIIAECDGQRLLLEVKGWPSTTYVRGERAGQPKPTQPTLQATHWFAEVLTSLIRRGNQPHVRLAMGLPDMPRYRTLLAEAAWTLDRLDIAAYLVTADGTVETWKRRD